MIGKIVGNYRFEEKIGEGGVGEVYRATDTLLKRTVAIKSLRSDLASQPKVMARFRSEAEVLAQLNHTNIATLYALVREAEGLWMVMEFVEGRTFSAIVRESGPMPLHRMIPRFRQALDGIGYAHERGIVHRDVKGSNIMLGPDDVVKVMDFGIARALGSSRLTRHGHMVGTLQYMSPEQVRGEEADARSDIYSLGVLLYLLMTARTPFNSKNDYELMHDHIETPPPSPRKFAPEIPEPLERAVMRALEKSPDARFQATAEFSEALEGCVGSAALETVERVDPPKSAFPKGFSLDPTRVMSSRDDTSEASTIDRVPPTAVDVTRLEPSRRPLLALARRLGLDRWSAPAGVLALLLLVNLLMWTRLDRPGILPAPHEQREPAEVGASAPDAPMLGLAPDLGQPATPQPPSAPTVASDLVYGFPAEDGDLTLAEIGPPTVSLAEALLPATRIPEPPRRTRRTQPRSVPPPAPSRDEARLREPAAGGAGGQGWIIERH